MSDDELVIVDGEDDAPYSKGLMAQTLMATGLAPVRAYTIAAAIERELNRTPHRAITLGGLREVAHEALGSEEGDLLIARYLQWRSLRRMEVPVIILVGGATGVGKSTIATQLAQRLGINRVASTDMVRQVMRAFFSEELMPALHYSSFEAAESVRVPVATASDLSKMGFIEQTKSVAVGISSLLQRATIEGHKMIMEGVHVVPGFIDRSQWQDALVMEFVIAVTDPESHRRHFAVREWETGGIRPLRRYLDAFPKIRRIQKYILAQAAANDVPVIDNVSIDETVKQVMAMILQEVGRHMKVEAG